MAFDTDFLNGVLNNEETTAEQKVGLIIAEHEASERGLVQKRDQLLESEKKLKEKVKGFEDKGKEFEAKISSLEEQLKNNDPEAAKKYYESQLAAKQKEFDDKYQTVEKERDFYRGSHLDMIKERAFADAIKDIQFVDGLKEGFKARLLSRGFEVATINGQELVVDKDSKTIADAVKEFVATAEGKAYIKAGASGAGSGSNASGAGGEKTMTQAEFQALNLKEPMAAMKFIQSGGKIV